MGLLFSYLCLKNTLKIFLVYKIMGFHYLFLYLCHCPLLVCSSLSSCLPSFLVVSSHPLTTSLCAFMVLSHIYIYASGSMKSVCAFDRRRCSDLSSSFYILWVPLSLHLDHVLFIFSLYFYMCMPCVYKIYIKITYMRCERKHVVFVFGILFISVSKYL